MAAMGVPGQAYEPAQEESAVTFAIRNFGLNVNGDFKNIKGKILFNPKDLRSADFKITVDAFTINTGNSTRDKHLKQPEYFDVAIFPELAFTSIGISQTNKPTQFRMTGNIRIKGKVKPLSFPFTATPTDNGYLFGGSFKLNRVILG